MENTLFFGDNLDILRGRNSQGDFYIAENSVDCVYLDPPFNSKRAYNMLFRDETGAVSPSLIRAFDDTWNWASAIETYGETLADPVVPDKVKQALAALRPILGANEMMAYLAMMTPRLVYLYRKLKPTGNLFLHCDPTASHYLKLMLDLIFSAGGDFRNEIIWQRHEGHSDAGRFGSVHDTILFYRKSAAATFNRIQMPYSERQLSRYRPDANGRLYTGQDLTGAGYSPNRTIAWRGVMPGPNRHWMWSIEEMERLLDNGKILLRADGKPRKDGYKVYLDEMPGKPLGDVWTDISRIPNTSAERLGYPTQKPLDLLRRIITVGSNPGDVVLDPFCGCGTATDAAQELGRHWIGIDVTHLAVTLIKNRLHGKYGLRARHGYKVIGEPRDLAGAQALALEDREQFEYWALGLVSAVPWEGKQKKGADRGRDGMLQFQDENNGPIHRAVISVKSGKVESRDIRDLRGTIERERAPLGIFVTLNPPTDEMKLEAAEAEHYAAPFGGEKVRRIQILTIAGLLNDTERLHLPRGSRIIALKHPARISEPSPEQQQMTLLTKVPNETDTDKPIRAGAKRKATA